MAKLNSYVSPYTSKNLFKPVPTIPPHPLNPISANHDSVTPAYDSSNSKKLDLSIVAAHDEAIPPILKADELPSVFINKFTDFSPKETRIIAIANQKGGVGKTTTAINLATALAACKMRVLILDNDSQGNASTGLGISASQREVSTYDLYVDPSLAPKAVTKTNIPGLSIIPSTVDLAAAEIELVSENRRSYRLKEACEYLKNDFDYILIDCPPALGLLTINALSCAQSLLIPLQCEFYALEGLGQLLKTVERVKRAFNPDLVIQGIVLTMYDNRNNLSDSVAQDVREHLGAKVYETIIPRNVKISEAPSYGKPVLLYDFKSRGAQAYIHLASEVMRQERQYPENALT